MRDPRTETVVLPKLSGPSMARAAAKMKVKPDRVPDWERSGRISLAQADGMARHTRTPLGYLFLKAPPTEDLSIPDYRTHAGAAPVRPTPELLDTIHLMRRRQPWMRDELVEAGAEPLPFVGTSRGESSFEAVAEAMREALSMPAGWAATKPDWTTALRFLRDRADESGVLTVFNGIVGNNISRKLDRSEFQGFALVDSHAPLVFVNAADYKAAQMFTLAHELAHLFVGAPGLTNLGGQGLPRHDTERFCNAVAAEFLVPAGEMIVQWTPYAEVDEALQAAARRLKVSVLVAARRAVNLELIRPSEFRGFYERHTGALKPSSGGGNFWNNQNTRIGRRFGSAVYRAVLAGRRTYREAYSLTGLRGDTFDKFLRRMKTTL
ncbi:MAG: ImmA/IrrE family metallo-endopeptidase [Gemmatimonadota bacterium]|nr:ImmA/IrrE family metallo-endopeptidase [Gemmatimonadota bacterium]